MRKPGYLAALASSAVPGLDPVAVRAARGLPGNRCDVAFVTDTQHRAWVVRVPTTAAVGAQLDTSVPLLALISRRLPFQVPSPRGFIAVPEGRAMVYPFLHGRSVVLEETPPGPGVAAEIGRALAALHNVDRAVFEEAGLPAYDSETYRRRHLADLDRAAATGHVPTALLSRWERALEDVSAWRFAPTPVHGDLGGGRVLVSFTDEEDSSTASVRAITGWEHAQVADPADDFAGVADECSAEAFESVLEAYAVARIERPDRHLRLRARLASELRALRRLLDAVTAGEPLLITRRAAELRALDERTADLPDLVPPPPVEPQPELRTPVTVHPANVASDLDQASHRAPDQDLDPDLDDDADIDPLRATGPTDPSEDHQGDEPEDEPGGHVAGATSGPEGTDPDDRDTSQDTQRLRVGDAAEATTVIPADELSRLRAERVEGAPADPAPSEHAGSEDGDSDDGGSEDGGSEEDGDSEDGGSEDGGSEEDGSDGPAAGTAAGEVVEVEVERTTATDESWYQVVESVAPDAPDSPESPDAPEARTGAHAADREPVDATHPTVVLVETSTGTGSPDDADPDAPTANTAPTTDAAPTPDDGAEAAATDAGVAPDQPAATPEAKPGPRRRHRRATRP